MDVEMIQKIYKAKKEALITRVNEFKSIWETNDDEKLFLELVFCLLTPQSKAFYAWEAVNELKEDGVLWHGTGEEIAPYLNKVRFKNNKGKYIALARQQYFNDGKLLYKDKFQRMDDFEKRHWIVKNIKGIGMKEASHYLRNIGFVENLTILDRHVLRNLVKLHVIEKLPKTLSEKKYLRIEQQMKNFAKKINVPLEYLDLILWYNETGKIFK